MYLITGASGNTGNVVAKKLLKHGKKVRLVGRSAERLASLASLGAEPFVANVTDKEMMIRAFSGTEAAYVMLPPDLANPDFQTYQDKMTGAFVAAIQTNQVKHVVALSSIGADKTDKTGPIVRLHHLEEGLKWISGLNALFLRAGYFMENTLPQTVVVQQMGAVGGPLNPELRIPMIATRDIGEFAADALLRLDFRGQQAQELLGQRDLTYPEVAAIIGKAIGKPELKYQQLRDEQFRGMLLQMGTSVNFADLLVEMSHALNTGHVRALEARSARNTTLTSYEQFVAEEFVPAYQGKQAA